VNRTPPGILRQTFAILAKDLLVEWRAPSRVSAVFFFALAIVVLAAFASGPSVSLLRKQVAGTLWLGLLLASTRSLDLSFSVETEQGALEGLVLWPVDSRAVFYGKALANTLLLFAVAVPLVPLSIAIYDAPINGSIVQFFALLFFGCAAIAAPGTLYALICAQARGASVLLPVLLFPLVVPAIVAASRGAAILFEGTDPMHQATSWLGLLVLFDVIHWSLSGLLFGRILEDA
jgi:heme exporter protein B